MSAADTNDAWSKVYHEQFVCGEALFECGTERLNAVHFVVKDNTDAGYHTVAMEEKMVLLMSEFEASINAREQANRFSQCEVDGVVRNRRLERRVGVRAQHHHLS